MRADGQTDRQTGIGIITILRTPPGDRMYAYRGYDSLSLATPDSQMWGGGGAVLFYINVRLTPWSLSRFSFLFWYLKESYNDGI